MDPDAEFMLFLQNIPVKNMYRFPPRTPWGDDQTYALHVLMIKYLNSSEQDYDLRPTSKKLRCLPSPHLDDSDIESYFSSYPKLRIPTRSGCCHRLVIIFSYHYLKNNFNPEQIEQIESNLQGDLALKRDAKLEEMRVKRAVWDVIAAQGKWTLKMDERLEEMLLNGMDDVWEDVAAGIPPPMNMHSYTADQCKLHFRFIMSKWLFSSKIKNLLYVYDEAVMEAEGNRDYVNWFSETVEKNPLWRVSQKRPAKKFHEFLGNVGYRYLKQAASPGLERLKLREEADFDGFILECGSVAVYENLILGVRKFVGARRPFVLVLFEDGFRPEDAGHRRYSSLIDGINMFALRERDVAIVDHMRRAMSYHDFAH